MSDFSSEIPFVKMIVVGNSGAGKTGSLASLVPNYNLRILNFDGPNINTLAQFVKNSCPDRLSSISFENCRDVYGMGPKGPGVKGTPKALKTALQFLDQWPDGTTPAEWGHDHILVIDSLSLLSKAAYNWAHFNDPNVKDKRQTFFSAQQMVENIISLVTSDAFQTNVIVLTHIDLQETSDGVKGFPRAIGQALGSKIPMYFPTLVLLETSGTGENHKRKFRTIPTATIDLKTSAPFKINATYPISDGMAQIFSKLKEEL